MNATEQSRIKDAFKQWNDQSPALWFNYKGLGSYSYPTCVAGEPRNRAIVTYGLIDGYQGAIAEATVCPEPGDPSELDHYGIVLDAEENQAGHSWYTGGAAAGIGSNQLDFWGTLTHEYGHATGFGIGGPVFAHFLDTSACDAGTGNNTMCSDDVLFLYGKTFLRTLQTHDKHTFAGAYP